MDTDEMVAELCSLSQLEQAQITNEYLEDLSLYESSVNNSQALEFIGKTVATSGDGLSISNGTADDIGFELADDAAQVTISIYDDTGEVVKTIELGETSAGTNFQEWDGTDDDGEILSDGTYTFEIAAYDSDGDSVSATTYVMSEVTGINYQDDSVYLTTNNGEIAYGDVEWVSES
jgi:flagellar basal-body rod modification protein FlgD